MSGRTLAEVLEQWRDLERALRSPDQDDATESRLRSEIAVLRDEYQRMTSRHRAKSDQLDARVRDSFQRLHESDESADSSLDILQRSWPVEPEARRTGQS